MSTDRYVSPLSERYASKEMQYIFSPDMKFRTWRRLWIALAETEKELGLNITQEQIDELKAHKDDINYDVAKERERQVIILRFGLEDGRSRTLEEVGKEFDVTRERIRQIEAKALRKLRHPSRSKKVKDFLD